MNQNTQGKKPILSQPRKRKSSGGRTIALIVLALVTAFCLILFFIHFAPSHRSEPDDTEPTKQGGTQQTETDPSTATDEPPVSTDDATDSTTHTDPPVPANFTVVIDPGHGFWDTGCTVDEASGLYENTISMDIATKMNAILERAGVAVIFTHDGKTFPSVSQLKTQAGEVGFNMESFVRDLVKKYGVDRQGNAVDANTTWKT